jgi:hypothetical protein
LPVGAKKQHTLARERLRFFKGAKHRGFAGARAADQHAQLSRRNPLQRVGQFLQRFDETRLGEIGRDTLFFDGQAEMFVPRLFQACERCW